MEITVRFFQIWGQSLQRARDERDSAVLQTQKLQQELVILQTFVPNIIVRCSLSIPLFKYVVLTLYSGFY